MALAAANFSSLPRVFEAVALAPWARSLAKVASSSLPHARSDFTSFS